MSTLHSGVDEIHLSPLDIIAGTEARIRIGTDGDDTIVAGNGNDFIDAGTGMTQSSPAPATTISTVVMVMTFCSGMTTAR